VPRPVTAKDIGQSVGKKWIIRAYLDPSPLSPRDISASAAKRKGSSRKRTHIKPLRTATANDRDEHRRQRQKKYKYLPRIAAQRNIVERAGAPLIEQRVEKPKWRAARGEARVVEQRDEARDDGRRRRRATDRDLGSLPEDLELACLRGDVRNSLRVR
jgi:hypothetical protein